MSVLVFKGHATRVQDLFAVLKSLGGLGGECRIYPQMYYYVSEGEIRSVSELGDGEWTLFTLEEFEEKYPYKINDKVMYENTIRVVVGMEWDGKDIRYSIDYGCGYPCSGVKVGELQPYKEEEETMEEKEMLLGWVEESNGKRLVPHKDYEIKQEGDNFYLVKKLILYPKTYRKCCELLGIQSNLYLSLKSQAENGEVDDRSPAYKYSRKCNNIYKLLVCRDAYWKLSGWTPNWESGWMFAIERRHGVIEKGSVAGGGILVFPTEEMRDAFYENFKDLIEECRELL